MPAPFSPPVGRNRSQPRTCARDGDRPVGVGAQHGRSRRPQPCERSGCGVPVPVSGTGRDDRQARPDPLVQFGFLVCGAVVGDLDDIHRVPLRTLPQEGLLRGRFEVTEQEQRQARGPHQQGHAGIVRPLGRRARRGGPQHLPVQRPGPAPLPLGCRHDGYAGGRRGPPDEGGLPGGLLVPGGLNHTDRPAAQHPGQAGHVVGMEVREQDQRHPAHAQRAQAVVHRAGLRSGVHHHGRSRSDGEYGGVTLAHRALDVAPVGRRPAGDRTDELRRPQHGEEQQPGQPAADPPAAQEPGAEPYDGQGGGGQQQAARDSSGPGQLGPRQPRPGPGHCGDPSGGHPRASGEEFGGGHPHRGRREGREPEDGGRPGRQFGQQVARHRDQADPGREGGDDRGAHGLCGSGGRERLGEPGPHPAPAQGLAPQGSQCQQGSGGQDGQQEAVASGQPRVVEHQQQHGGGQGGNQGPAPPGGDGQEGDGPAGRGPQHARLRPAHHHERERQRGPAQGGRPQGEPEPRCQPAPFGLLRAGRGADEQEEHHGQVRPGHRQQVQQVGGPEGLVQVGRDPGGVADHQTRQQGPGVRREPLGGFPQPCPQPPGDPLGR